MLENRINVLFLLSDAYGGYGGISKFNKDFLSALNASNRVLRTVAIPRVIPGPIDEPIPEFITLRRRAANSAVAFTSEAYKAARSTAPNLVVCGHINLLPVAWSIARARRVPLALVIHGIEAWQPGRHRLSNALAGAVDCVVAVSQYSADRFRSWSGFPAERVRILPNSVDLDRFKPGPPDLGLVARYGLAGSSVVLTVGRLADRERYKGFDEVIEALPTLVGEYPHLKYLIVGDGPDRPRLERKAAQTGLSSNVIFAGRIPEDEKVAHYNTADIYAMPSSGEGFGIVLIEAAACGLPVIGSVADGSREALLGGELGELVDPRNARELTSALRGLLQAPPSRQRNARIEVFSEDRFKLGVDAIIGSFVGT